ncbi:MAG: response regulator [Reichenbachiella sp.]
MEKIYIICIEDQREVLNVVSDHLSHFEDLLTLEECESTAEARELIEEIDDNGDYVGVIVSDHVMPNQTGVDFLVEINNDDRFKATRKILLTGQATHIDTIQAINKAGIDKYVEKPWTKEDLIKKVSVLLTEFIIKKGIPYESYMAVLDKPTLFELLK